MLRARGGRGRRARIGCWQVWGLPNQGSPTRAPRAAGSGSTGTASVRPKPASPAGRRLALQARPPRAQAKDCRRASSLDGQGLPLGPVSVTLCCAFRSKCQQSGYSPILLAIFLEQTNN